MKISRKDVVVRKIDSSLDIISLFDGTDFKFDMVLGVINGDHGLHLNRVSDRIYFVLSGSLVVSVGDNTYEAEAHDTFVIPANTEHGVSGTGEFLIVTAPPFAPENEIEI